MPGYILVKTMGFLATRLDVSLIQTKTDIKRQWTKGKEPGDIPSNFLYCFQTVLCFPQSIISVARIRLKHCNSQQAISHIKWNNFSYFVEFLFIFAVTSQKMVNVRLCPLAR